MLELDRAEDAKETVDGWLPVTRRLAKNRNGAVGASVKLRFSGRLQTFEEANQ